MKGSQKRLMRQEGRKGEMEGKNGSGRSRREGEKQPANAGGGGGLAQRQPAASSDLGDLPCCQRQG